MRKWLLTGLFVLLSSVEASGQITVPYVFSNNTVADADQVNANLAKFADALNRTGGTMTGVLNTLGVVPTVTNASDLGSTSLFYRTAHLRTSAILGQTTANYTLTWANPAAARAISIADPGGTDVFTFNAATQTLTNKTLTAPVLGGTVTGTYTLAGTPTITSPAISGPTLSGTVLGTYTLGGTPTIPASGLTGTLADARLSANVPLLNAANTFTGATQTIDSTTDATLALDSGATSAAQLALYRNGVYKWSIGAGAASDTPDLQFYNRTGSALRMTLTEAGLLTVSGFGTHSFSAGGTGENRFQLTNPTAGTGNFAGVAVGTDVSVSQTLIRAYSSTFTTSAQEVQSGSLLQGSSSGGLSIAATHASGVIRFYTGGTTQRFSINADGDWLKGTSIMDSTGTPTIASGFGTSPSIAGNDYAMKIVNGTTANNAGDVTFGRTWTTAPVCTANWGGTAAGQTIDVQTDTTTLYMRYASTTNGSILVLCRGY